jgi:predicted dithiol-disulfide oxidoreductase (DUF899 family)
LLVKEKAFTRQRDALSRERRELPWVKVEKNYVFDTPDGPQSLSQLFGKQNQLIVYHFMLGPGWQEGCPGCSFLMDHADGMLPHLNARGVGFVAISRGNLSEIAPFQKRMGWKFRWASSSGNNFNFDYGVSFSKDQIEAKAVNYNYQASEAAAEELPGMSAFFKDASGNIFHTYSTYARGLETLVGTYSYLDLAPLGRSEEELKPPMSWIRHHDRYAPDHTVDASALYSPAKGESLAGAAAEK